MTTIDMVREHQSATGSSADTMMQLLCGFIDMLDDDGHMPHDADLGQYIADHLTRLPGDVGPINHYDDPRFTDADKDTIISLVMEEIRDCVKDLAHEQIAGEPLIELISYADPDPELTARILYWWGNDLELDEIRINEMSEEDDPETGGSRSYENGIDYARRMGLLDDRGVTPLGHEYKDRNL